MLRSYTNNRNVTVTIYDDRMTPIRVGAGQTVQYWSEDNVNSLADCEIATEYDAANQILYIGYAIRPSGRVTVSRNAYAWAIKRRIVVNLPGGGNVESWQWAGGRMRFRYRFSQRANYTYR